jgi:hypothetical protein
MLKSILQNLPELSDPTRNSIDDLVEVMTVLDIDGSGKGKVGKGLSGAKLKKQVKSMSGLKKMRYGLKAINLIKRFGVSITALTETSKPEWEQALEAGKLELTAEAPVDTPSIKLWADGFHARLIDLAKSEKEVNVPELATSELEALRDVVMETGHAEEVKVTWVAAIESLCAASDFIKQLNSLADSTAHKLKGGAYFILACYKVLKNMTAEEIHDVVSFLKDTYHEISEDPDKIISLLENE